MKQQELVLFGAAAPVAAKYAPAVQVVPRFVYEKVKKDGKWVVVKDAHGNKKPLLDKNGQKVVASQTISLLPRKSEEKQDLHDATKDMQLTAQGLMQFEREARDLLLDEAIAEIVRLRASGQYTFARETRNVRNGAIALTVKPVFGGKSLATTTDEEFMQEAQRRGMKVQKDPTAGNGGSDQKELTESTDAKPAKKNGKKGNGHTQSA